jgi:hypothetical protein
MIGLKADDWIEWKPEGLANKKLKTYYHAT